MTNPPSCCGGYDKPQATESSNGAVGRVRRKPEMNSLRSMRYSQAEKFVPDRNDARPASAFAAVS